MTSPAFLNTLKSLFFQSMVGIVLVSLFSLGWMHYEKLGYWGLHGVIVLSGVKQLVFPSLSFPKEIALSWQSQGLLSVFQHAFDPHQSLDVVPGLPFSNFFLPINPSLYHQYRSNDYLFILPTQTQCNRTFVYLGGHGFLNMDAMDATARIWHRAASPNTCWVFFNGLSMPTHSFDAIVARHQQLLDALESTSMSLDNTHLIASGTTASLLFHLHLPSFIRGLALFSPVLSYDHLDNGTYPFDVGFTPALLRLFQNVSSLSTPDALLHQKASLPLFLTTSPLERAFPQAQHLQSLWQAPLSRHDGFLFNFPMYYPFLPEAASIMHQLVAFSNQHASAITI